MAATRDADEFREMMRLLAINNFYADRTTEWRISVLRELLLMMVIRYEPSPFKNEVIAIRGGTEEMQLQQNPNDV